MNCMNKRKKIFNSEAESLLMDIEDSINKHTEFLTVAEIFLILTHISKIYESRLAFEYSSYFIKYYSK